MSNIHNTLNELNNISKIFSIKSNLKRIDSSEMNFESKIQKYKQKEEFLV